MYQYEYLVSETSLGQKDQNIPSPTRPMEQKLNVPQVVTEEKEIEKEIH